MGMIFTEGCLEWGGRKVLGKLGAEFEFESVEGSTGGFLLAQTKPAIQRQEWRLGRIEGLSRFTHCYRYDPYWMRPASGTTYAEVHPETQYLMAECADGQCVLIVPLFNKLMRYSLVGDAEGLKLIGETGDAFTVSSGGIAAYVAIGPDPMTLIQEGARAVVNRLSTGRLRCDKTLPDFTELFGWCTWDAFYQEVSHDKVQQGLKSFAKGGVEPRLLILDDGWLDALESEVGGKRLVSFNANERFGHSLAPTVRMAKEEFKARIVLAWHAISGYWSGADATRMPGYGIHDTPRSYGIGLLRQTPDMNSWYGPVAGHVPAENIAAFYDSFHRTLAACGIDGVKVDNQATVEGLATGQGGRVRLYAAYRTALETSVNKHFGGRLINCMSNSNETHLMCRESNLLRTSTDFWPNIPATHGAHLYTNAQVGYWFGEFIQPDWDMFQSGHDWGMFHAAGRAVSGGPVYVSDKPDTHDFPLLHKLVLSDGTVLRCREPGRPTRDCLFRDPTREDVLLKVVNYNDGSAVIGAFNCQYHEDPAQRREIEGSLSPADAPSLAGEEFALYAHTSGTVRRMRRNESFPMRLSEGGWELFTIVPVMNGVALIGLADKLNSAGAVSGRIDQAGACEAGIRDGGTFVAWCAKRPGSISVDGREPSFEYDAKTGLLTVTLSGIGACRLAVKY